VRWTRWPWFAREDVHLIRFVRSVTIAAGGSLVVYVLVLWNLRLDPLRTALGRTLYSDFYDIQARAFLDGNLHVPSESLGIEAFVHDGRDYMYFTPGPALARIPLLLVTDRFDGRLTAISMLLAWVTTVVFLALFIWRVRRVLRGRAPLPVWEAAAYGCLVVAVGGGSVLVYLASQPWVYHEAYAWAVAAALACAFTLLGVIERPDPARILACSLALLLAVLCRATTGLAFGLAIIGTAVWFLTGRHGAKGARYGRLLVLAAAVPLLIGMAINQAKFDHPFLFPLEEQVWSSVNEHRQEALEANGGGLVALDLLPSTLTAYFRPDGIRFVSVPPFITFPQEPAGSIGGGFLDQTYRTGSTLPFMPALVGLGVWGLVTAFRPRGPDRAAWVRPAILGAGAICGAVLVYGYIAYRYVAELLPVLAIAATVGLVDLGHLFMLRSPVDRRRFLGGLAALTLFGVVANRAVGLTTAAYSNPGPQLDRYLGMQEAGSRATPGDPLTGITGRGDVLPDDAEGEHLFIVGDCDGLYVGQAETYWPWVSAEVRAIALALDLGPLPVELTRAGRITHRAVDLLVGPARGPTALRFERRSDGAFRLVYDTDRRIESSDWTGTSPRTVELRLEPRVRDDEYDVLVDGEEVFELPLSEFDGDWYRFQNLFRVDPDPAALRAVGVTVRELETEPPPRCARLLDRLEG
jgi:hypothetical protein